jgi:hypothetical protein
VLARPAVLDRAGRRASVVDLEGAVVAALEPSPQIAGSPSVMVRSTTRPPASVAVPSSEPTTTPAARPSTRTVMTWPSSRSGTMMTTDSPPASSARGRSGRICWETTISSGIRAENASWSTSSPLSKRTSTSTPVTGSAPQAAPVIATSRTK